MSSRAPVSVAALALLAGLASPSLAAGDPAPRGDLVPLTKAGVLYVNMATGERSLTLYNIAEPEIIDTHATASLFDYWMSVDENPCWDDPRADGLGWSPDLTTDPSDGWTQPIVGWDYGDMPFDSQIAGIVLSTATLATDHTDSNGDGVLDTGIDSVAVFFDGLSDGHSSRSSTAPPTASIRVESVPGNRPFGVKDHQDFDLVIDFGGDWFELGDSDGQGLGALWLPGAAAGADVSELITTSAGATVPNPNADGLADFQYMQYYAQHGNNDKVTSVSTFISLGAPGGELIVTVIECSTTCSSPSTDCCVTVTSTFFVPDELPQGQSAFESIGIGMLGSGGDVENIQPVPGLSSGCCYWFGGLDCSGFLSQLDVEPPGNSTWYNFSPYAQNAMGLFSNTPHENSCTALDLTADGILDNADIGAFITLFLAQDPLSDLNADGITDNGDIGAFVQLFLACAS
ncbi:MAG: hypothetical protein ACI89L_002691 [Phycisphaerales bacterium]|jgi:hypothetical protein